MLLDQKAIRRIEKLTDLAPLHNAANARGVRVIQDLLGHSLPQVAVFDTSFHQTLPERAFLYRRDCKARRRLECKRALHRRRPLAGALEHALNGRNTAHPEGWRTFDVATGESRPVS